MNSITKTCDECESTYFSSTSNMETICPECSHVIYGYEACEHEFKNDRCVKCHWDGSTTEYIKNLKHPQ